MRNWFKDLSLGRADYNQYINSIEWKNKRKKVLERDRYTCQECKTKSRSLDVHHLNYETIGDEDLGDLISLCRECHKDLHTIIERERQKQLQLQKKSWEEELKVRKEQQLIEKREKNRLRVRSENNDFEGYFDGFKLRIDKIRYYDRFTHSKEINLNQFKVIESLLDRFSWRPELQIPGLKYPLRMYEQLVENFNKQHSLPETYLEQEDMSVIKIFKSMVELVGWLFGEKYEAIVKSPNRHDCRADFYYWPNCECDKTKLGLMREDRINTQKQLHYIVCQICGKKGKVVGVKRLKKQQKQECLEQRTIIS